MNEPDAFEATEYLKEHQPDLIILDLGLPDKPGYDLLQEWRHAGVLTPVVIVSSRTDEVGIAGRLRPARTTT
ncbi:two-component system, OmpR family, KDP operon response regulator KdpE [Rhizobium tibeticum]|uniref:Two-component system, OmpR family, KDP operon response regulator KdpE n=1 Tax=Rhizobium tibeticum TaxID=501024 RepID=A0A1H8T5T9_9HYPH|nr:Virulence transcriptional regulatory protein PhoP [Rhizobium tibeticum]SEO86337.1 two-component system, OmpR family, KDP operon response regulator KdpE [Rhizobium tibeticum]